MLSLKARKSAVCNQFPSTLELLVSIDPDDLPPRRSKERPALNLALVLDRSQSMEGRAFELTLEAACKAVGSLTPRDTLVVVVFDDTVDTLFVGRVADREEICRAIRSVQVGGTTNLYGGWHRGAELLASTGKLGSLSRVVLLTDGHANEGVVEPANICHGIRQSHSKGIQTTTLGFGLGYSEELLTQAAAAGQGNHGYIEDAERLGHFFEEEMTSLLRARGSGVRLSMNTGSGVEHCWLGELHREEDRVLLANLVPGEPLAVLASLDIFERPSEDLVSVELSWFDLEKGEVCSLKQSLSLPVVDREKWEAMQADPQVESQLARHCAERYRRAAVHLLKQDFRDLSLQILDAAKSLVGLPQEDRQVVADLIETVQGGDRQASYKKAAMYSHGHGSGHARLKSVYAQAPQKKTSGERKKISLPINLASSLFEPLEHPRPEWPRVAGMLRGHFYGERLVRGNRVGLGEGATLTYLTLGHLLSSKEATLAALPRVIMRSQVEYPTTSLQRFRARYEDNVSFWEMGTPSAGCAALRRICPFLVTGRAFPQLDATLATMLTHSDSMAMASSAGYCVLLWHLLRHEGLPRPDYYLRTFCKAIAGLERDESYECRA